MFTKAHLSQPHVSLEENQAAVAQINQHGRIDSSPSRGATLENRITRSALISHGITISLIVVALFIFLVTPFMAITWSRQPFPGFVVEHTLVIANINGGGWSGQKAGLNYPQRVISVDGESVSIPG